jgi:hypothetical protein
MNWNSPCDDHTLDLPQASTSNMESGERSEGVSEFLAGDKNTNYCDYHNNTTLNLYDDVPSHRHLL